MEWIINAIANVLIESLNGMLKWTSNLVTGFSLEVWNAESDFAKTFPGIDGFLHAIQVLAMFIVIMGAMLKLYQALGGPFTQSEEPGVIAIRTIGAGTGVILGYRIFALIVGAFNGIYSMFVSTYLNIAGRYRRANWNNILRRRQTTTTTETTRNNPVFGDQTPQTSARAHSNAFNLFGGDGLINKENLRPEDITLGIIIIELVIGCTLMICFFRLLLEAYERYVIIGVMYFTAPLVFSSLISKNSNIFKNWCQMLISQIILMCFNLVFLGVFMASWYSCISGAARRGYVFNTEKEYLTAMFLMIGWLLAGQKLDEHLRSLGLSAAQTGSGIMGAMMGGAAMAMTAMRTVSGLAGGAGRNIHNAATGQTKIQKAIQAGNEGRGGGIYGEYFGNNSKNKAAKEARQETADKPKTEQKPAEQTAADNGNGGGGIDAPSSAALENHGLPQPQTPNMTPEERAANSEATQNIAAQVADVGSSPGSRNGALFDAQTARVTEAGAVPNGRGNYSVMTDDNGRRATIYEHQSDAEAIHGTYKNRDGKSVPNYAEVKVGKSNGAIHFDNAKKKK